MISLNSVKISDNDEFDIAADAVPANATKKCVRVVRVATK